jgi:hypothetical protein
MSKVEGMYSVDFIKKIERARFAKLATQAKSETSLRNSLFDILRFDSAELVAGCGSLS